MEKSQSTLIEKILFKVAKQWIAGDTMDDALKSAHDANAHGMNAILNQLGEHYTSNVQVSRSVSDYFTLVSNLRKSKISGGLSIKPTQVGLSISEKQCIENLDTIIGVALQSQSFVWIDMESSEHTDDTLRIYQNLFEKYERLGLAIQSNLKRSQNDLEVLLKKGSKIRLVKGAYRESAKNAYKTKHEVDKN
ncbi:MAG TPA: proline dehydrogenase family protein, partial [Candidatus Nitrosotalea sp.]|nr:proline dehydrogenase family protein [Candidatus Nitrosotalea sp.]